MARKKAIPDICRRIAQLRQRHHGNRGKANFAKELGISPSTYNYYEAGRVPPAELLVRIADLGKIDLRWLLTGETSAVPVPADHPAVTRIAALLAKHHKAAEPLSAFVDMLAATFSWPAKPAPSEAPSRVAAVSAAPHNAEQNVPRGRDARDTKGSGTFSEQEAAIPAPPEEWIPVLGRSAAGVPQFWADDEEGKGLTLLSELVERHARRAERQVQPASVSESSSQTELAEAEHGNRPEAVQLVTLREPDEADAVEFVVAGALKRRHPDAFAVRIDGDSMSPEVRHGDIVICSASGEAADGAAAVVQLAGQIGVTCKIFRRQGRDVHLVPINETYPPQKFPLSQVAWARRVLARVRPGTLAASEKGSVDG